MTRILIFSDTHSHTDYARVILDRIDGDMLIHLGDYVRDFHDLSALCDHMECHGVAGNGDFYANEPTEKIIHVDGISIFLTHGHGYGVKSGFKRLVKRTKELGCDAALFGHTHVPICEYHDGILLANPGGYNSMPRAGCAIAEIENSRIKGCLYTV